MPGCPNSCAPKVSAPNAWVPLWLCSKKPVPQMPGCPYGCAPSYSAPTVVPLMQCASFRLPRKPCNWSRKSFKVFQFFHIITGLESYVGGWGERQQLKENWKSSWKLCHKSHRTGSYRINKQLQWLSSTPWWRVHPECLGRKLFFIEWDFLHSLCITMGRR